MENLALSLEDLTENVVRIGNPSVEHAAAITDRSHERPVCAVAKEKSENPDIVCFRELMKFHRIDDAFVGHAIRDENDAGRPVVVEFLYGHAESLVDVGPSVSLDPLYLGDGSFYLVRRRRDPSMSDFSGGVRKGDDTITILWRHLTDDAGHTICQSVKLGRHAARGIKHIDVVGTASDGFQINARSDDHHEGAIPVFVVAERNHFNATREILSESVVDNEFTIQGLTCFFKANAVVTVFEFFRPSVRLAGWFRLLLEGDRGQ
ncbi:MAG: hypothetical protein ACI8T1_002086 [Verrucomicrobiales bacterium]|jgi:hypothetical protein